jgi:hypothetical protein
VVDLVLSRRWRAAMPPAWSPTTAPLRMRWLVELVETCPDRRTDDADGRLPETPVAARSVGQEVFAVSS